MATHKLTEVAVKNAIFGKGPKKKRTDGQGLFVQLEGQTAASIGASRMSSEAPRSCCRLAFGPMSS